MNRTQELRSSLLRPPGSLRPGLHSHLLAGPVDTSLIFHGAPWELLDEPFRSDPERLRRLPGLPQRRMLVLDALLVPRELHPAPADPLLALALLALCSEHLYAPDRPLVFTQERLDRTLILCTPHDWHALS